MAGYFLLYHSFSYLYGKFLKPDKVESNTEFVMQNSRQSSQERWCNEPYIYCVYIPARAD